jgi:DNA-binding CsgD family transcriptional regulator
MAKEETMMTTPAAPALTPRELEVVRSLAQGFTYAETAARLGMSAHTVTSHIKNLYRKLDVHCAAAAVMRSIDLGLLGEPRPAPQKLIAGVAL